MKNKLKRRIAWRNIVSYKQFMLPFILCSSIMGMLFFISASLLDNKFVQERNANMIDIMRLSVALVGIFTVIFTIYCNSLISKVRSKEIALYEILGMEKKTHKRHNIHRTKYMLPRNIGALNCWW